MYVACLNTFFVMNQYVCMYISSVHVIPIFFHIPKVTMGMLDSVGYVRYNPECHDSVIRCIAYSETDPLMSLN